MTYSKVVVVVLKVVVVIVVVVYIRLLPLEVLTSLSGYHLTMGSWTLSLQLPRTATLEGEV